MEKVDRRHLFQWSEKLGEFRSRWDTYFRSQLSRDISKRLVPIGRTWLARLASLIDSPKPYSQVPPHLDMLRYLGIGRL